MSKERKWFHERGNSIKEDCCSSRFQHGIDYEFVHVEAAIIAFVMHMLVLVMYVMSLIMVVSVIVIMIVSMTVLMCVAVLMRVSIMRAS